MVKKIQIKTRPIRLGQFLKYADMVDDGLQAKLVVQSGEVLVNNLVETRRGKQLEQNDTVQYGGVICQVNYQSQQSND